MQAAFTAGAAGQAVARLAGVAFLPLALPYTKTTNPNISVSMQCARSGIG
eukprot:COSAG05_NODE_688_length_7906_cov_24.548098_8_plen_50_part_00